MPQVEPTTVSEGSTKWGVVLADLGLLMVLLNWLPYEKPLNSGLSLLIFIAILWLTEATHITFTALLIPVLSILMGLQTTPEALISFANPIIFLFFGGFALAAALHQQGLDRMIANRILALAKGRFIVAALLLFLVSALLSMWISNTATTAMMLPLALGLLGSLDRQRYHKTFTFILLGIAYSASIGGIATLVGSPPNAIAASEAGLSFRDWMAIGLPISLLILPFAILTLYLIFRPALDLNIATDQEPVQWSVPKVITLSIFVGTISLWIFSKPLAMALGGIDKFDSWVAIVAVVLIGVTQSASWKKIEQQTDWGVLLLFGGGLTLSSVLKITGTSVFLAESLTHMLTAAPIFISLLGIAGFVIFLTEMASNTASAALLIPVFAAVAEPLGLSPIVTSAVIAVAASCAFMLPVATPPNAIVFGSGCIRQKDMMRAGLVLNILCVFAVAIYFYWLLA
ncbi:DASS family sodium-coupled anion symporter [Aestuariicella hydrocarbonica]|uniref:DASS family sodium-coupled anion symporter n=1 Tax=Pseudomaricurvus hydrocarbonicus TaxID=1470433 RepID=A0A9E5MJM1_9GAMM|nr:DASS family sodium-coupled anion symporter [Aestuariicella hydrocarbonica]NHO65349.1 DASS family sodium-coupled anion symporter [Aestuariicella hydrocarbonica]